MSEKEIINVLRNLFFDEYEWFLKGYDEQTKEQDAETIENAIKRNIRTIPARKRKE